MLIVPGDQESDGMLKFSKLFSLYKISSDKVLLVGRH